MAEVIAEKDPATGEYCTLTGSWTRGGITGVTPCLPGVWLARLAVIDEQIREGEHHLLPLAWLRTDRSMRFENVPTEFGSVSMTAQLAADGGELRVTFAPRFRFAPQRIVLYVEADARCACESVSGGNVEVLELKAKVHKPQKP